MERRVSCAKCWTSLHSFTYFPSLCAQMCRNKDHRDLVWTFGGGPRTCVGKKLSETLLKVWHKYKHRHTHMQCTVPKTAKVHVNKSIGISGSLLRRHSKPVSNDTIQNWQGVQYSANPLMVSASLSKGNWLTSYCQCWYTFYFYFFTDVHIYPDACNITMRTGTTDNWCLPFWTNETITKVFVYHSCDQHC